MGDPSSMPGIILNSPIGSEPAIYKWPLSYTCGGQKFDGACEIIETIRWVSREFHAFRVPIENLLHACPDTRKYEHIATLCNKYNKIINEALKLYSGTSLTFKKCSKPTTGLLKHIINIAYNYAVINPDLLNKYEPFTSGVYGETSFDFISQMIDEIQLTDQDVFVDLGSGVGQVVLQVAASTPCKKCIGIEKADVPSKYAVTMDSRFRFWMSWFGKECNEFELIQGDFFEDRFDQIIKEATFIFVNNFAFEPSVDHKLKQKFIDLRDGAKIISSKRFCPPKSRVTERCLTDIGSIMHVREIEPRQSSAIVSWTDRPISYYLHVIDGSRVEQYYERRKRKQAAASSENDKTSGKACVRRRSRFDSDCNDADDNTVFGPTTRKAVEARRSVTKKKSKTKQKPDTTRARKRIVASVLQSPPKSNGKIKTSGRSSKKQLSTQTNSSQLYNMGGLDLLHAKTVQSIQSSNETYRNPAPGCVEQKLDSYQETSNLPNVVVHDFSLFSTRDIGQFLTEVATLITNFAKYMQTNSYKESLNSQIDEQNVKRQMLNTTVAERELEVRTLEERAISLLKRPCADLAIACTESGICHAIDTSINEQQLLISKLASLNSEIERLLSVQLAPPRHPPPQQQQQQQQPPPPPPPPIHRPCPLPPQAPPPPAPPPQTPQQMNHKMPEFATTPRLGTNGTWPMNQVWLAEPVRSKTLAFVLRRQANGLTN